MSIPGHGLTHRWFITTRAGADRVSDTMSKTVRYGIIGCGMMGHEHIRNIALLPHTSVAAIFDPDSGMQKSAAELAPDAVFTETLEELLGLPDLDCLVVVSPNYLHAEQLRVIASQNPLPLLMEKPLFTDMADAEEIKNYRESYPAPIWVAMEYRYMPIIDRFIQEIRLMQQSDEAIHMLTIREHRFPFLEKVGDWNRFSRNTGGTLVEKCCHFFDLMRFIHQSKPVRVFASGGQSVNHLSERYFGETPDILDNGYVLLDFENGARAMLELCMFAEGSEYQEEISAVGPAGKILVTVRATIFQESGQRAWTLNVSVWLKHSSPFFTAKKAAPWARPVREVTSGRPGGGAL